MSNQLEEEKKKNNDLKKKRKDSKMVENWWEEPIEELNLTQLTEFECGLRKLRDTVFTVATEASKYLQAPVSRHNFYAGSSSNPAFGISGDTNIINTELDLFNDQRVMNMSTFNYDHNMNHTSPFGNNGNSIGGFAPEYRTEDNQNQNQYVKQEHVSEYAYHPHFGHDYY